ncbi:MAG: S-ribosylhomocysteine lyase [Clostridia bacterium]|nr:S-ribosylhomocysteine lyase [Clostridia bacterium]
MEKIKSFTIDHMTLLPGVYVSRVDRAVQADAQSGAENAMCGDLGNSSILITTYDIRITRPNFETVMSTAEIHTIEHLGATWLRNNDSIKNQVIYWGPMGCRTGFYLIMSGSIPVEEIKSIMSEMFQFIADYEGEIPGATPVECGNYSDMDLPAAKTRAANYLNILK